MIRFHSVTKSYGRGAPALVDVTLHVAKGEFVFVTGQSGAGKSTLLKLVYMEELPTSGEVRVSGTTTTRLARRDIPRLRRRLGVIFQNFLLLEDRTAAANVAFALEVTGAPRATIGPRVQRALAQVGLAGKSTSYPHELSGGEQQRIAIARALVNSPAVLIADEPTGNLDDRARRAVFQLLREVNASGTAVLMATHDLELVKRAGLRTIEMDGGRIVSDRPAGGYPDLDTLEAV
jgi:cell division transport system ATP-binding protein